MEIRPLVLDDVPTVVPLLSQLGYPTDVASLTSRIRMLEDDPHVEIWVAADESREVLGLLSAHLGHHIELDGPVARLTALVTGEKARGRGIGQLLIDQFEDWARSCGSVKAVLTSGNHRSETHEIYRHLGWEADGVRFTKKLP